MDTRRLGRTELIVSRLGLGTVKLGRNKGVNYPEPFEVPSDAEVDRLLQTAFDAGVRFWDTAPAYGVSEERLGSYVRRWRDDLVLCSKAGEEFDAGGSRHDFSASAIHASVDRSLKRLKTDYLDLLLLHSDGQDRKLIDESDAVATLNELKEAGKVRAIGISAKTVEGIRAASKCLDVIMAPFSQADPSREEALREASELGCGILAIKVLAQGHGEESVESSLRFVAGTSFVDVAVIGTRTPAHLLDAVSFFGEA